MSRFFPANSCRREGSPPRPLPAPEPRSSTNVCDSFVFLERSTTTQMSRVQQPADGLLNGTGDTGENVVGVGADQANSSNYNDQNHGQHNRILGDVLSALILPQVAHNRCCKHGFYS